MIETSTKLYLGLDLSTQQLKAVVLDHQLSVVYTEQVDFDADLPQYHTTNGVHINSTTVTSPTLMWVSAVDMLFSKLSMTISMNNVVAISGCGQQHGSVYWRRGSEEILNKLKPESTLTDQLTSAFSISSSPVWMDSSTTEECERLETAVGGAEELAELTGSRAFERFTGAQIMKLVKNQNEVYKETEVGDNQLNYSINQRISLVSSFVASLLIGQYAPIDWSDASGMNLMNIKTKEWHQSLLDTVDVDGTLLDKLGEPVAPNIVIGHVSEYFCQRYRLPNNCKVISFLGDNPASLVGMDLRAGDVAISCGTSDTVFLSTNQCRPTVGSHTFANASLYDDEYMALLCYKNGAITRDRVRRDVCACTDWSEFDSMVSETPPGNNENIGLYYDHPEILPHITKPRDYRFTAEGVSIPEFKNVAVDARAVLEHQCMAKRIHAEAAGFKLGGRILLTGGASVNQALQQILADVFQSDVYTIDVPNSAALAANSNLAIPGANSNHITIPSSLQLAARARPQFIYDSMASKYAAHERTLV